MEKSVKINLGCGIELQKGFINVDLYDINELKKKEGVFKNVKIAGKYVQADVRKLPFPDEYADYILASEILEHIPLKDLNNTLREWVRVLKKGGRMVITCPDFDQVAEDWLHDPFTPEIYGDSAQVIYGSQLADGEYHKSPITKEFMQYYLGGLVSKGTIAKYPRGTSTKNYPGKPAKQGFVYRNGVIHCDVVK